MSEALSEGEAFRELLARHFGLRFDDGKLSSLDELLQRRADARGLTRQRYVETFRGDPVESVALAEELTVGETYFFRNLDQFDAFRDVVLPDAMKAEEPKAVRSPSSRPAARPAKSPTPSPCSPACRRPPTLARLHSRRRS